MSGRTWSGNWNELLGERHIASHVWASVATWLQYTVLTESMKLTSDFYGKMQ